MDRPERPRQSEVARIAEAARAHPAWVAFAAALIPRLIFLFELRASSPTFDAPEGGDSILYDRIATGASIPLRAYFHSPLYITFLKTFYRILGRDLFALRLAQNVIGALGCALVAHVTLKLFRSRRAALGAGLLAAVSGPVLFYEGQLGVDALMPFLVMACMALALNAWRRRDVASYAFLGAAIGITALGRAVVLAWIPVLLAWELTSRPARWKHAAALVAGAALMILPATIHNLKAEGDFVAITANGGLNFYVGNNEGANGAYVPPQGLAFRPGDVEGDYEGRRAAEDAEGRELTSSGVSAWWSRRAWTFISAEPGQAIWLMFEKMQLLVSDVEYPQLHDYRVYAEVAPILRRLPTAAYVVIPGLAGLLSIYVARERRPFARRLAVLTLVFAASFLPFFVVGRYRAPWLLLLAPFAASWGLRVVGLYREGAWRSMLAPAMLALAVGWLSTLQVEVPGTGFQYMNFARASLTNGDPRRAAHWCERALHEDPSSVDAVALLGRLRRQEGRYDDAEEVLASSVARDPKNPAAWLELGRVRVETGHLDTGIEAFLASVDADPRSLEAWTALAEALRKAGRDEEAAAAERSLERLRASVKSTP
jgi:tetratricopeptide (TPR) repeat protein